MRNTKTYQPEDYVFVDEITGETYISTPHYDVLPDLGCIVLISLLIPVFMSVVLWLYFGGV